MTNLTLAVDVEVLRKARVRAINQGTSVNTLVRQFLDDYAKGVDPQRGARRRLLALTEQSTASSEGHSWTRDELHD